jgi:hypothetical protein
MFKRLLRQKALVFKESFGGSSEADASVRGTARLTLCHHVITVKNSSQTKEEYYPKHPGETNQILALDVTSNSLKTKRNCRQDKFFEPPSPISLSHTSVR